MSLAAACRSILYSTMHRKYNYACEAVLQVATTLLVRSATGRTNSGFALACGHFSGIQIVPTNAHVCDVVTANDQAECTVALKHHVVERSS